MVTVLDRSGLSEMVRDILRADTTTLYGTTKYLQLISSEPEEFAAASVNVTIPYGLFIDCEADESPIIGSRYSYEDYLIRMRFECNVENHHDAYDRLSLSWERIKYLVNYQMYSGLQCTSYYTNATSRVVVIEPRVGSLPKPEDRADSLYVIALDSAIYIQVMRTI